MSEGFVVVSRWGPKLHQVGCTCGVCKSRRKEQAKGFKQKFAGQNEYGSDTVETPEPDVLRDEDSQPAVGAPSSDLSTGKPPDQTKAQSAELNISSAENEPDTANGISTAPAEALLDVQQPTQLKKKALKTRLNLELAALGTPEMSLTKVRVPRQAATAAKAAIKKDLLQHSSRPNAASVPAKASALPAVKAVDSHKKAASTQQKKKNQQAKGVKQPSLRVNRELKSLMADDLVPVAPSPAGPTEDASSPVAAPSDKAATPAAAAAPPADLPAAVPAAASSAALGNLHASPDRRAKSDKSHGSGQQDTAAAQDTMQSPMLSDGSTVDIMDTTEQDPARPHASTPHSHPPLLRPPKELSPVEQFAQEVRRKAKWGPAVDVNVRGLMASAALAGEAVHIQLKNKEPVYLQGVIQENGMVKCAQHVGGPQNHECSLSEFEKLGNSKERRPGENIHLTTFSLALKDFCGLVNDIGEKARSRCLECKQGSGLIRCKGCSVAAHPLCVGLNSRQQQANWFCAACKASGQDRLPQRPQDLQGRARAPAHRPPPRPQPASAPLRPPAAQSGPQSGKKQDTSCVSPAGRVHMAVPVSGMTPARRERNGNKHKRLFMGGPGGLTHGEPVEYRTVQQGLLLKGEVHIKPGVDAMTGILCHCCHTVVSCSKFEAHAGQGSRRAPYDNIFTAEGITLRARAAMLPPLAEGEVGFVTARGPRRVSHSRSKGNAVDHSGPLGGIADGCRDVINDLDHDAGGCNICGRPDFALGPFCDRTMILCDQCECEFHVGCLRKAARCDLSQLPTGDWFCSESCSGIWQTLNSRVSTGPAPLDPPDYTLQLMRGRDTSGLPAADATNAAIDTAQQVLQESFDPIIDKATKENLLLLMTKAQVKGEYDYRGMYTALLTHQGRAVCAAVFRAFGAQLAEVPLVATKADARRQGHCRVLMAQFESIFKEAGVRTMCLPAAHETVHTWIHGFGLQPMPDEDLDAACKDLRMLIFPGTQVLQKQLLPPLPPREGPLMTPPWAEETALPMVTEGQSPAGVAISDASQAAQPAPQDLPAVRQDASTGLKGLVTAAAASMRETVGSSTSGGAGSAPSATQSDQSAAGATPAAAEVPAATQYSAPGLQASAPAALMEPTEARQDTGMRPAEVSQGQLLGLLHDQGQVNSDEGIAGLGAEADTHPEEVLQTVGGAASAADQHVMSDEVVDVVSLPLHTSHLESQDMSVQADAPQALSPPSEQLAQPQEQLALPTDRHYLPGASQQQQQQHLLSMPTMQAQVSDALPSTGKQQPLLPANPDEATQTAPQQTLPLEDALTESLPAAMEVDLSAQPQALPAQELSSAELTDQSHLRDTAAAGDSELVSHQHASAPAWSAYQDERPHSTAHVEKQQQPAEEDAHLSFFTLAEEIQSGSYYAEPPAGLQDQFWLGGSGDQGASALSATAELEHNSPQECRPKVEEPTALDGTAAEADVDGTVAQDDQVLQPSAQGFDSQLGLHMAEPKAEHRCKSTEGQDSEPQSSGLAEANGHDWSLPQHPAFRPDSQQSNGEHTDSVEDVQNVAKPVCWAAHLDLPLPEQQPSQLEHASVSKKRQMSPCEGADAEDTIHAKRQCVALSSSA